MNIGFIQGRLSEIIDGKIQAFPWKHWKSEFAEANKIGLSMMEWTLDQERIYENPFMNSEGQVEIKKLMEEYGVTIPSLTGDCFMQAPFYKVAGDERDSLVKDFKAIIDSCSNLGTKYIVFPLVDNGRLDNEEQEEVLVSVLMDIFDFIKEKKVEIVFESDFEPKELLRFINRLPESHFGINYDSGNSAALGFNPEEEIQTYGHRIKNVHIKDRLLGDTTVALGTGNTDFNSVFRNLNKVGYNGNWILQTARAKENDHTEVLLKYKNMVKDWYQNEFKS